MLGPPDQTQKKKTSDGGEGLKKLLHCTTHWHSSASFVPIARSHLWRCVYVFAAGRKKKHYTAVVKEKKAKSICIFAPVGRTDIIL
jgi:hypothetical protein